MEAQKARELLSEFQSLLITMYGDTHHDFKGAIEQLSKFEQSYAQLQLPEAQDAIECQRLKNLLIINDFTFDLNVSKDNYTLTLWYGQCCDHIVCNADTELKVLIEACEWANLY